MFLVGLLDRIRDILGRGRGKDGGDDPPAGLETVELPDWQSNRSKYDFRTPADIEATPGTEATEAALETGMMPVVSSWVNGIRYVPKQGEDIGVLYVRFHDGALVAYEAVPLGLYDEMFAAGSKGRFVHRMLWTWPHRVLIRSPRKVGGRRRRY